MKNIYDDSGNNNVPDYENNLAFPPQEIKSQDDIKKPERRQSDVLITALEKCEKLENENQQLKELLRECKGELEYLYKWYSDPNGGSRSELLHKIDNAIGEKK